VSANAIAELAGLGTVAALGFMLFKQAGEPDNAVHAIVFAAVFVMLGAIEGAIVGIIQRAVLVTRLPTLKGWVRATIVGAMVAWAVGMVPSTLVSLGQGPGHGNPAEPPPGLVLLLASGLGAVAGPVLALFQWLRLRKVVTGKPWLWLPANAAAWAVGMPIIFLGAQANEITSSTSAIISLVALALLTAGAVVGAIHGWALLQLVNAPRTGGKNAA